MLPALNCVLRFLDISRFRAPSAWIGGVFGLGLVLSFVLWQAARGSEERELMERAAAITHEQLEKLNVSILRSMEVLHSVAALHRVDGVIERRSFEQFVQGALARQPELQAISWNPLVSAAARPGVEARTRADGLSSFTIREHADDGSLVPAGEHPLYVPVQWIEPMTGNADALGYDLHSDPCRRRCLEEARDSGRPVATAPIRLAQLPSGQAGFLVVLPVYRLDTAPPSTVEERRARLAGFAVAVFKVAGLVGAAFEELQGKGIAASLFDDSLDGPRLHGPPAAATASRAWLNVAGRRWVLAYAPTAGFVRSHGPRPSWLMLAGSLVFTLLSTAYLYGGWRRTMEIDAANAALRDEVATRQRAEAAAAAANQAKSDFLASMSHEIRTPLNAILGYAQLLQRDPQLGREQRDSIHGISTGGRHLLGLINEILDLSKIEAGRMELHPAPFDLAALGHSLATTLKPLCARKRIRFRFQLDPSLPRQVVGDEGKLRQVLINLLGNAVKFTHAGEVFLGFRPEGRDRWRFEVIDTGLGIPAEEQPFIFQPFHQGSGAQHQGGTGLGLAIARRQVELLGGTLEVQSERGLGSRFHFCIPLPGAAFPMSDPPRRRVERLAPGQSVHALVVDDRLENREILGLMLSRIGCTVAFAECGEAALDQARARTPDIVFLDLLLPGMRGTEVARRLHAEAGGPALCIVMHSAAALPAHREESLAAGCAAFVGKPFASETIYECLQAHLRVAFQYADPEPDPEPAPEWAPAASLGRVSLPESLCARLAVAAELHSATALKAAVQELRALGPDAQSLAEELRHLLRSFDMDGIQQLLSRVVVPLPAAVPVSPSPEHDVSSPSQDS